MDATLLKEEAAGAPGAAPVETHMDIAAVMADLGHRARAAARRVALAPADAEERGASRHGAHDPGATCRRSSPPTATIWRRRGRRARRPAFLDRLTLDVKRVEAIAAAVESIADLPDPVGRVLAHFRARRTGL